MDADDLPATFSRQLLPVREALQDHRGCFRNHAFANKIAAGFVGLLPEVQRSQDFPVGICERRASFELAHHTAKNRVIEQTGKLPLI